MSNMVVNTNVLALNAHRSMKRVGDDQTKASAKLSSGQRINSAADDAAGLAISEKMRAQIRGLDQASRNSQDGISLVQTADGGLQEVQNMVQRARELTVQSANDTLTASDRAKIDLELTQLGEEVAAMGSKIQFNTQKLLNGTGGSGSIGKFNIQTGANDKENLVIDLSDIKLSDLNIALSATATGGITTTKGVSDTDKLLKKLDADLENISTQRAKLGAYQNRLEYTVKSLDISSENLSASESRIRDTDMAKEMMNLTKANVLSSAAMNMLSQANQQPQNLMQILR